MFKLKDTSYMLRFWGYLMRTSLAFCHILTKIAKTYLTHDQPSITYWRQILPPVVAKPESKPKNSQLSKPVFLLASNVWFWQSWVLAKFWSLNFKNNSHVKLKMCGVDSTWVIFLMARYYDYEFILWVLALLDML